MILVVPPGDLGATAGVAIRGMDNNVYTQIDLVLIIVLARKNAILMTSFAFILGVLPLMLATGAGAISLQSLGTAVFGGMISSTFLAIFFVPD